jgi:hypothetical protein
MKVLNVTFCVLLAFSLVGCAHATDRDVLGFARSVSMAVLDGDADFINSMLPEGEFLSKTDIDFVFGDKKSVREVLLKPSLKIDYRKVDDWTKTGREFYRIYYIAAQSGGVDKLTDMKWMQDYAVCLFEYKSGSWVVPFTFCYSETDWE